MTTYRLGSTDMCSAPGIVRFAINGAHFESDRAKMVDIIAMGWNVPRDAATALVTKAVPYTVEGETVIFTVEG